MSRLLVTNKSFELLEPYEGKLSRTVLRGESSRKGADLLDIEMYLNEAHSQGLRSVRCHCNVMAWAESEAELKRIRNDVGSQLALMGCTPRHNTVDVPVLFWAAILWGFTMIHEVGPSQVGIKERLGKVVSTELLEPGIYWTLPYPFGQVKRFSCTEVKQVIIGESEDDHADEEEEVPDDGHGHAKPESKKKGHEPMPVVLWTAAHGSDANNFIVAVNPDGPRKQADGEKTAESDTASIAFIRMMIPIEYRIRPDGVMDYAYRNADPVATLIRIGQQAATEYLASVSIMDIMSTGRAEAQQKLLARVQKLADEHHLGIEITKVMILDSHPPVEKVAPAFQDVIGAMEEKESTILKAESYAARTVPETEAAALRIISDAKSYSFRTTTVAKAESGRFSTQLKTYNLMPRMFRLKAYLDFLENDCKDIRKFIVAAGLDNEVYELNFETKERLDLIDVDAGALSGN